MKKVAIVFLMLSLLSVGGHARRRTAGKVVIDRPKLVLILVIDQFRADYLWRFSHLFGQKGFKRLLSSGAVFVNAHYPYSNTETAVGHASIATGALPSSHGIIANKWYDREAGEFRESVYDATFAKEGIYPPVSPKRLSASTLADQLRLSNNFKSRAYGISLKDRSAILTAGNAGTAAFWFDTRTGNMISSKHYLDRLPQWVEDFNTRRLADSYFGKLWERLLPEDAYSISDEDDAPYERAWASNGKAVFPIRVAGRNNRLDQSYYEQLRGTPFGDEYLLEFVKTLFKEEKLGLGEHPDLLTVSFSSLDLCGHAAGPYSQEVQDMVLRLDRVVAELLDTVDKQVGLSNAVIAFTADHGVAPHPDYSKRYHLKGGRLQASELVGLVERELAKRYGQGDYVLAFINAQIYLNTQLIADKGLNQAEVEEFIGKTLLAVSGIAHYYTRSQLLSHSSLDSTPIGRRVQAGFHAKASGDVLLVPEPFYLISESDEEKMGTDHGSPYHYDTHVPVILFGRGIKPGNYTAEASPTDIAPTLSYVLKVESPNCSVGRILSEALFSEQG
ncbi:MAG: alkaline phosphatase family protein [Acidobacteriota bacterium]|nr:alkaline phosphatase family protein [Blastocatellia bacterium]MDW8411811.1 alkaline phosphatase family protein [Acidobacteriota bacterium]